MQSSHLSGRAFLYRLYCIGVLPGLYTILRIVFWIDNRALFAFLSFSECLAILIRGLQQDFVSILLLNSPVFLLLLVADWVRPGREVLSRIGGWLFVGLNSAGFAINILDIGYFRFSRHRSNKDLVYVFRDSMGSLKSIVSGYWLLIIGFVFLVVLLVRLSRLLSSTVASQNPGAARLLFYQVFFLFLLILPTGLLSTGSVVVPSTPLLSVSARNLPIAQNSVSTFLYSVTKSSNELVPRDYFSPSALGEIVRTRRALGNDSTPFVRKNVVIFILESFSRCYLMPGDPKKASTPFFDSLLGKSLFFPNSFANGLTSNQGIVSILGGLPGFLEEPFYYSEYANTPLESIGNVLKSAGYETDFFMGAGKDHFGFGRFSRMAGMDHSYSRDDFNASRSDGDQYYDGNWGIYDEPFLQYGAGVLGQKQQPFLASFFTISAHPPYTIPGPLRERFANPGKSAAQRSIAYTDYSFQRFFETCREAPWFRNTLFVFCADHWLSPDDHTGYTYVNSFTIPFFVYDPSRPEGAVRQSLAEQVDLAPTVLDMLHYKGYYTGFGRSLLDPSVADSDRYSVSRVGDYYQIIGEEYVLGYDFARDSSLYLYRYKTDSLLKNNLLGEKDRKVVRQKLETWLRGNIQAYNNALIRRSLD